MPSPDSLISIPGVDRWILGGYFLGGRLTHNNGWFGNRFFVTYFCRATLINIMVLLHTENVARLAQSTFQARFPQLPILLLSRSSLA